MVSPEAHERLQLVGAVSGLNPAAVLFLALAS